MFVRQEDNYGEVDLETIFSSPEIYDVKVGVLRNSYNVHLVGPISGLLLIRKDKTKFSLVINKAKVKAGMAGLKTI